MTKHCEELYPFVGGGLAGAVVWLMTVAFRHSLSTDTLKTLYEVMVNIGAISIGFLGTILAILFSLSNSRTLRHVRQAGRYQQLVDYLLSPIYWYFWLVALSTLGLVVESEKMTLLTKWISFPWISLVTGSFMASFRAMNVMVKILKD